MMGTVYVIVTSLNVEKNIDSIHRTMKGASRRYAELCDMERLAYHDIRIVPYNLED